MNPSVHEQGFVGSQFRASSSVDPQFLMALWVTSPVIFYVKSDTRNTVKMDHPAETEL